MSYIQSLFAFVFSWYHGEIGRSPSEGILMSQKPGLFLVRDSTTCKGGYVLSVRYLLQTSFFFALSAWLACVFISQEKHLNLLKACKCNLIFAIN